MKHKNTTLSQQFQQPLEKTIRRMRQIRYH